MIHFGVSNGRNCKWFHLQYCSKGVNINNNNSSNPLVMLHIFRYTPTVNLMINRHWLMHENASFFHTNDFFSIFTVLIINLFSISEWIDWKMPFLSYKSTWPLNSQRRNFLHLLWFCVAFVSNDTNTASHIRRWWKKKDFDKYATVCLNLFFQN